MGWLWRAGSRSALLWSPMLDTDTVLRGCIGEIFLSREIWKVIREQAYNAAFQDPRFSPLTNSEADELEIDQSTRLR